MMFTKQNLVDDIKKLGVKPQDTLLIHSSLKSMGEIEGGADTVLDAFTHCVQEGLLVFPTHTWFQMSSLNPVMDLENEMPCVGILPALFMKRPGVLRSWHPTHSVAAWGKDAGIFIAGEEMRDTPCARDGCWGKLYDRQAKILFLGCEMTCNTFLHGVEEWHQVPDRISSDYEYLKVKVGDRIIETPQHRHLSHQRDYALNYIRMKKPTIEAGITRQGKIGQADCYLCDAVGLADMASEFLQKNIGFFNYE